MIRILLPDSAPRPLAFFLALEEWVAHFMPEEEYFFTWNVNPTVIIGRNQDLDTEVDVSYCRLHDIDIVRRRSGGGCVYADRDNIMMSYVSPQTDVEPTFARYTAMMAAQLRKMGFDAEPSGRNDIVIGNRKISGNAYYLLSNRSVIHGTMLFDTNLRHMLNAITPTKAKLESHQVTSVASRIVTVRQLNDRMPFHFFLAHLTDGLETGTYTLTDHDIARVKDIEKEYYAEGWLEKGKRN